MPEQHHLSDEDRARLGLQVDLFIDLMSRRYGLDPAEVIEAVRWVQHHREFVSKLKHGGTLALIGTIVTSVALTIWEGAKAMIRRAS